MRNVVAYTLADCERNERTDLVSAVDRARSSLLSFDYALKERLIKAHSLPSMGFSYSIEIVGLSTGAILSTT